MKSKNFIYIIILILTNSVCAQWDRIHEFKEMNQFSRLYFYNENFGIVYDGSNDIYITNNGGNNWDSVRINFIDNILVNDISFYNNKIGWIAGEAGLIFKTFDGGYHWAQIDSQYSVTQYCNINAITIIDSINVLFAGGFRTPGEARILKTADGGTTLKRIFQESSTSPEGREFLDMNFINDKIGYIISNAGNFYKTEDSGSTWILISKNISIKKLYSLNVMDIIGLDYVTVLNSNNGGYYWEKVFDSNYNIVKQTGFLFKKFFHVDSLYFWSLTWDGELQRLCNRVTKNGGKDWVINNPILNSIYYFNDMHFPSTETGYAIMNNSIYKTNNSGISSTNINQKPITNQTLLFQNYPNPFNPITNIEFAIPEEEYVELNIYNSLGQKIKVIINEVLSSGNHNVTVESENFSSGIYFYQLKTKNYTRVKKMLLLK